MIRAALVFLVFSLWAAEALSAFYDGNALFADCEKGDENNPTEWGICMGYTIGLADAFDERMFCVPPNAKQGQVTDVVKLWLRDHPEKRHSAGSSLVLNALKEKFPCE